MKKILISTCAVLSLVATAPMANAADSTAANGSSAKPVPIDYWAVRNAISNVSISPEGTYLALMKIESKDGDPIFEIYETADLSKPPKRLNAKPMEFLSFDGWLTDDVFFGTAMQIVRKHMRGAERDTRSYRGFSYSVSENKFNNIDGAFNIASMIPADPDHIVIGSSNSPGGIQSDDPFAGFRPTNYYKFNIKNGRSNLILRGGGKQPQYGTTQ